MTDDPLRLLMDANGARVMALLARTLGSREEAEDAFQETWYAVWQALPHLRPAQDPWPFIRKAALRKAIDRLRRRPPRAADVDVEHAPQAPTRDGPSLDLRNLPDLERLCLTLFFWEGLSVREIASQLEVPTGTVKTWMFRARARLREQLGDDKGAAR